MIQASPRPVQCSSKSINHPSAHKYGPIDNPSQSFSVNNLFSKQLESKVAISKDDPTSSENDRCPHVLFPDNKYMLSKH